MHSKKGRKDPASNLIEDQKLLETLRFHLDLDGDVERAFNEQIALKGSLASVLADDPNFDMRMNELIIGEKWGQGSFMPTVINGNDQLDYDEIDVQTRAGEIDFTALIVQNLDLLTEGQHLSKEERVTLKGLRKAILDDKISNMRMLEAIEPIGLSLDVGSGSELNDAVDAFKAIHGQEADELPAIAEWFDKVPDGSVTQAANAAGLIYGLFLRKERDLRVAERARKVSREKMVSR